MEFVRFDTTYLLKWNMWEKCGGIRKIREYLLILYCIYEEVEILNWIHRLNKKNFVGRNVVMFDKNLLLILISFKSLNEKNFKFFLKKKSNSNRSTLLFCFYSKRKFHRRQWCNNIASWQRIIDLFLDFTCFIGLHEAREKNTLYEWNRKIARIYVFMYLKFLKTVNQIL